MPLKLNVPFSEKDHAKAKGAFWDQEHKLWFAPDHKSINDFIQWLDTGNINIIIKTPFYVARNSRTCWKCKNETELISLYSNNFYQLDDDVDEVRFEKIDTKSFLSNLKYIDPDVQKLLSGKFTFFKKGFSKTINDYYWANHCQYCNSLQGDYFNHSEPGGAFFPLTDDECRNLELIKVTQKFDLTINGNFSYASNEDQVFELARKSDWK